MRGFWLAAALGLIAFSAHAGEQQFPYKAYINADDVHVRSGPGPTNYPTQKLQAGQEVEVYRHDPGGWYAIRPPEGSFSWVSARYLKDEGDNLAGVTGDNVAARVGSELTDRRDIIQVRLERGELVEILDTVEVGTGSLAQTWHRISPPSGEFRWVYGKYVDPDFPHEGVRKAPLAGHPLVDPGTTAPPVASTDPPAGPEQPGLQTTVQTATPVETLGEPGRLEPEVAHAAEAPPGTAQPTSSPSTAWRPSDRAEADSAVRTASSSESATQGTANSAPAATRWHDDLETELNHIDMQLSLMLVKDPRVWDLTELGPRAEAAVARAQTAVERGRAKLLLAKVSRSREVQQRYERVLAMRQETQQRDRQLAQAVEARMAGLPQDDGGDRYDGVGRLTRVLAHEAGSPRYVLVDQQGKPRFYVTPAPGVNLLPYLGKRIGVSGNRGFILDQQAHHVMAKHVDVLESRTR